MTRGIDTIPPGSRVRVIGDILAGDPANSVLIGREGLVGNEDAGIDVAVAFEGDPIPRRFNPSELQVIDAATDCPHGYRPSDSCPCCDAAADQLDTATNRLMSALALHEDARDTVRDALQDAYDAGREAATHAEQTGTESAR